MAFTNGDDINVLQQSDTAIISADSGNDTYIISPVTMGAGQVITLSDEKGTNTLQLIGGLTITKSIVVSNALQLTLSSGAVINVNGADTFTFDVGGNAIMGTQGEIKNFQAFSQDDLGITVPAAGESPVTGGQVVMGEDLPPVNPDEHVNQALESIGGTVDTAVTFDAAAQNYNFTDDAAIQNNVAISNFTNNDLLTFGDASNYSISNDGADVDIIFNNDGTINRVTLMGVVTADDLVYDEASLNTAIGFDAIA